MANLEDGNRESVRREDPKEKEKQTTPGQREGGESGGKYSSEGQGKNSPRQSGGGSESYGPGSSREREQGRRGGQGAGSSGKSTEDPE